MPSLSARDYVQAKRGGRATSVRVQPTGTAVDRYQVPLGNRHSLRPIGALGLPAWSDRSAQTETWVRVPRLSATCPRRVVAFDGGKGSIDRCMEFGDEFNGTTLDTAKWTANETPTISSGTITINNLDYILSKVSFSTNTAFRFRGLYSRQSGEYIGYMTLYYPRAVLYYTSSGGLDIGTSGSNYTAAAIPTGTHIYEIVRNGTTNVKAYLDGGLLATGSAAVPSATMPVTVLNGGVNGVNIVDWLFVRKYVAAEPLAGTAQPSTTNRALSRPMSHADLMRAVCA